MPKMSPPISWRVMTPHLRNSPHSDFDSSLEATGYCVGVSTASMNDDRDETVYAFQIPMADLPNVSMPNAMYEAVVALYETDRTAGLGAALLNTLPEVNVMGWMAFESLVDDYFKPEVTRTVNLGELLRAKLGPAEPAFPRSVPTAADLHDGRTVGQSMFDMYQPAQDMPDVTMLKRRLPRLNLKEETYFTKGDISMWLQPELLQEMDAHMAKGRPVEAIKAFRSYTMCGLKEAKDFVDANWARYSFDDAMKMKRFDSDFITGYGD